MKVTSNNQLLEEYIKDISKEVECYVIFNSDCHLNEYIHENDRIVYKISNFSGSNGTVVLCKNPVLLTDSRYYISAIQESKFPLFKGTLEDYLIQEKIKSISFDTKTISSKRFKNLLKFCEDKNISFIQTCFEWKETSNTHKNMLIDLEMYRLKDFLDFEYLKKNSLTDRKNQDKIFTFEEVFSTFKVDHNECIAGISYKEKISMIQKSIRNDLLFVSELDTIAWILNLRGSDIEYNPLFYSYLLISNENVVFFCDKEIERDLHLKHYDDITTYLKTLKDQNIIVSGDCNQFMYSILEEQNNVRLSSEFRTLQSTKNENELFGMALAYFYDGIALTELFCYMNEAEKFTEKDVGDKLHEIKLKFKGYIGPSFETISCTSGNCAIVHHRATNRIVEKNKAYLIDCGSQYLFGTTDTSRTMFFGNESDVHADLKHDYTLVLKGQLNSMMTEYKDSFYCEIDKISRQYLKDEGKDFGHATGHGVGHFLCVHEMPPCVSPGYKEKITENQVFSIEPGFYKENSYGIRIENLVISRQTTENTISLLNITLVPYQNKLLQLDIMTKEEKEYYSQCNQKCIDILQNYVSNSALEFLERDCCSLE